MKANVCRPPDRDRAAVYAAELAAFDGTDLEVVRPFEQLVAAVDGVVASSWWPAGPVEVCRSRRDAASSVAQHRLDGAGTTVVRLAAPQHTLATVAHELAHAVAGPLAAHGAAFRRAHVDVAVILFDDHRAQWLADAYASFGLVLGQRRWAAPPAGRSGSIALA